MITRSKQSLHTSRADVRHVLRRRTDELLRNSDSENVPKITAMQQATGSLLTSAFSKMSEGVWWRILPINVDCDCESIASGIGISWEDLLPLLVHYGLLYAKKGL